MALRTFRPSWFSLTSPRSAAHVTRSGRRGLASARFSMSVALGLPLGCGAAPSPAASSAGVKAETKATGSEESKAATGGTADSASAGAAATPPGDAATAGAVEPSPATGGPVAETTGAPDEAGTGGAAGAGSPEEIAAKIEALVEEVKSKKTKDARALLALDEAKALAAQPRVLAEAATKRGKSLNTEVERATVFFEWARAVDEKWPDATFELAKFACNTGDIDITKELLTEVKARGGKKLLKTVEFDPTFALVASDPEVLALLK